MRKGAGVKISRMKKRIFVDMPLCA